MSEIFVYFYGRNGFKNGLQCSYIRSATLHSCAKGQDFTKSCKKSSKILNGPSEAVNQRRTETTMDKR